MKTVMGLILAGSSMMWAEPAAALRGRVTDASGAPLAGASVVIREANGLAFRQTTNELGDYRFDNVPAAKYTVRISKPGFHTYESGQVAVSGTTYLDRKLAVPGPVRTITAADWDQPAPDLRPLLTKWRHVKLVPEFTWSAPAERTAASDLRARKVQFGIADVTASRQPAFVPAMLENQPAFRVRFTF